MDALTRGREILEEFASFGTVFEIADGISVVSPSRWFDTHPAADAFIAASPEERDLIRARADVVAAQKRQRAQVAVELDRARASRPRRKDGQRLAPHEERAIRDLAARGLSAREIERRTGIGRATVGRRLAGIAVQKQGRRPRAA